MGGYALQIGAIALLTRSFDCHSIVATAIGLELAALHNFFGHSRWTWSRHPPVTLRDWAIRYGRYQLAKTASLVVNLAITALIASLVPIPIEIANTLAVVMCALPNYLVAERLVFTR
jgi:putative flippase GtrA